MCWRLTLIEELLQSNSFPVDVSSWGIVSLRVVDHEPEIGLESSPVLVKAAVELGTHGTQVHRVLDDLEVTRWGLVNVDAQIGGPLTLGPYHERDPRVGGRVWHVCALAISSERSCKHPSRIPTSQRIETLERASSCLSPSPASGVWGEGRQNCPSVGGRQVPYADLRRAI